MASAHTEIMAMVASPLIFVFCPVRRSRTAQSTVTPSVRGISSVSPSTAAIAIAPKATWESPRPVRHAKNAASG